MCIQSLIFSVDLLSFDTYLYSSDPLLACNAFLYSLVLTTYNLISNESKTEPCIKVGATYDSGMQVGREE